jgi:outer membrane protein assembly factor BamD (BamD/ComL family)
MNTRITNRRWRDRLGDPVLVLVLVLVAVLVPAHADAAAKKKAAAAEKSDDADDSAEPEVKLPPILLKALHEKEAQVTDARREAIGLIEAYLRDSPHSKEQAEALYKLAELYWEESKAVYLEKMAKYQDAVTACHNDRAQCPNVPRKTPSVDLAQAQAVYLRLINNYPKFRKIDTVIYLYAFSLRDQGKTGESIKYFQTILDKYPRSRYIADAWMAIAEFRFYEQQNYKSSLEAYEKVLAAPEVAALRPGAVQDRLVLLEAGRHDEVGAALQGRARSRQEEGGPHRGAAEARRGAAGAGARLPGRAVHRGRHQERARRVRVPRADRRQAVLAQGAEAARRHGVRPDPLRARRSRRTGCSSSWIPNSAEAPDYHGKIVESYQLLGDVRTAVAEMRKLAATYGGRSAWAAANKDRPKAVEHARTLAEGLIRTLAKTMHARRSRTRRRPRSVDKERYARAAESYEFYIANFPDAADAVELRYLRADILYFKLGKYEEAGREYLAVGKSQPVASSTRTPCCRRWARSRRCASRASARSPRPIACSARRPTSTRRCSRRTRRSSPSSTRTGSSSSTTATTTRRSSASA